MQRATQLREIMAVLAPEPLDFDSLRDFFVETSDARDPKIPRRYEIAEALQSSLKEKVLVMGHSGTGKSTELVKFQEENATEYAFFSFSLRKELQIAQISVEMLLVLAVEAIIRAFQDENQGKLNENTLESIYNWFNDTFKISETDLRYSLATGAGADTKNTYWGKLLGLSAYLKADFKAGSHTLNKSITKENKRLSELVAQCNLLIRESKIALAGAKRGEMVLIVEDLDKVYIEPATSIFIENPSPLLDLDCKAIFTAPLWLLCNPRASDLDAAFSRITIPMIKVSNEDGSSCAEGRKTIEDILDKRLDVDSLISKSALKLAIEQTGGVLRHLFKVLTTAASVANQAVKRGRKTPQITVPDVRYGLDRMRSDLVKRIGVYGLPKDFIDEGITVEKMFDRLREIHIDRKTVESSRIDLLLLQAHAVIEYNGKGWHRVHPLIAEYIEERYAAPSNGSPQSH